MIGIFIGYKLGAKSRFENGEKEGHRAEYFK